MRLVDKVTIVIGRKVSKTVLMDIQMRALIVIASQVVEIRCLILVKTVKRRFHKKRKMEMEPLLRLQKSQIKGQTLVEVEIKIKETIIRTSNNKQQV